jgi:hypothetical protein
MGEWRIYLSDMSLRWISANAKLGKDHDHVVSDTCTTIRAIKSVPIDGDVTDHVGGSKVTLPTHDLGATKHL